ncbi:hypothetical protein BHE74_00043317 [Ensete ventricosum]|nr:hypothetical protein BHE74_00043317 [Ensete ventricosum]
MVWSLSSAQARPHQLMVEALSLSRFSVSGVGTSGGLLWESLGSVYAKEDMHKEDPLLVLPGGSFILIGRKVNRSLDLTSAITSGVAASYSESVGAEAWREGVACHVSFMVRGGSSAGAPFDQFHLGYRRGYGAGTGPSLTRILTWLRVLIDWDGPLSALYFLSPPLPP